MIIIQGWGVTKTSENLRPLKNYIYNCTTECHEISIQLVGLSFSQSFHRWASLQTPLESSCLHPSRNSPASFSLKLYISGHVMSCILSSVVLDSWLQELILKRASLIFLALNVSNNYWKHFIEEALEITLILKLVLQPITLHRRGVRQMNLWWY